MEECCMEKNSPAQERIDKAASGMTEKAYEYIVQKINALELAPNSKINAVKLAETLNISRTPVRNALEQLADEGYVYRTSGGFKVAGIDPVDFMGLTEARQMIESTAAYMAADVITGAELAELKNAIDEAESAQRCGDMAGYAYWDGAFHEKIVQASRNHYIINMYKVLEPRIHRYQGALRNFRNNSIREDTKHAKEKHMAIYSALKSRYSSLARDEMEEHLRFTNQYLFDMRSDKK